MLLVPELPVEQDVIPLFPVRVWHFEDAGLLSMSIRLLALGTGVRQSETDVHPFTFVNVTRLDPVRLSLLSLL